MACTDGSPDGYYQAMNWTGKPTDIVSVPPIEKKMGGRGAGWMTAEQASDRDLGSGRRFALGVPR